MNTLKLLRGMPRTLWNVRPRSTLATGTALVAVVAVVAVLLTFKSSIQTFLRSGESITVEFDRNFHLQPHQSKVKIAGLDVGVVSDVERTADGKTWATVKIDDGALDTLGSEPSAEIVPNTILSGQYAIEIDSGGGTGRFKGDLIPSERTTTPVQLDKILESLPKPTRRSLQSLTGRLDSTLDSSKDAARDLVQTAPKTLGPARDVLTALQGKRPGYDLPRLVTNLDAAARVLTRHDGQLASIAGSLEKTTAVLAQQRQPLADGIIALPPTLRHTRATLTKLDGTLEKLTATAGPFRPTARELDALLRDLNPVLQQARPLLADLRPLLADARPAVQQLVPVTQRGTATLAPLQDAVLDRVNGPIKDTVMSTWRGAGPYKNSGGGMQADHKFYEELGYLVANMDRGSMTQDRHGAALRFQVGANTRSVEGNPLTLPTLLEQLRRFSGGTR